MINDGYVGCRHAMLRRRFIIADTPPLRRFATPSYDDICRSMPPAAFLFTSPRHIAAGLRYDMRDVVLLRHMRYASVVDMRVDMFYARRGARRGARERRYGMPAARVIARDTRDGCAGDC